VHAAELNLPAKITVIEHFCGLKIVEVLAFEE